MKQLSLTSIISGTVIVLAPIIHNMVMMAMLTHLLALDPKQDFHLQGMLDNSYHGWCLFIGICLFSVGIVSGFLSDGGRREAQRVHGVLPPPVAQTSP